MRTVKITGHVYEVRYSWETTSQFITMSHSGFDDENYTYVGPVEIHYAIPDSYNPTAVKLAALQAKREEAAREFAATVRAIDEQISKLQALTCEEVAA
jgi:hypothetical protein